MAESEEKATKIMLQKEYLKALHRYNLYAGILAY